MQHSAVTTAGSIDLHTHILPQHWPNWTQRTGYSGWIELAHTKPGCACMQRTERDGSLTSFREIQSNCWDPAVRLQDMHATGVAMQVLSTVPIMFSYWAKPQDAYDLARLLNDHIASICREHPHSFAGLATIPLQDPQLAMRELDRCINDLNLPGIKSCVECHSPQGGIDHRCTSCHTYHNSNPFTPLGETPAEPAKADE